MRIWTHFILTLLTLPLLASMALAAAEPATISISHKAPSIAELPPPGRALTLLAVLKGTSDTSIPVRAMMVKDGRMMVMDATKVYRNESELATYEFQIYAPIAELSYQFVLSKGKQVVASQNFRLRRYCIPELEVSGDQPTGSPADQIHALLQQAKELEAELKTWEHASKAMDELKAALAALKASKKKESQ